MPPSKAKRPKRKIDKKDDSRERLERALDVGLEDTFPASDAVALIAPAFPAPDQSQD